MPRQCGTQLWPCVGKSYGSCSNIQKLHAVASGCVCGNFTRHWIMSKGLSIGSCGGKKSGSLAVTWGCSATTALCRPNTRQEIKDTTAGRVVRTDCASSKLPVVQRMFCKYGVCGFQSTARYKNCIGGVYTFQHLYIFPCMYFETLKRVTN